MVRQPSETVVYREFSLTPPKRRGLIIYAHLRLDGRSILGPPRSFMPLKLGELSKKPAEEVDINAQSIYAECIEGDSMARSSGQIRSPHDEAAFLASYDAAQYPRPSVAVDLVLLTLRGHDLRVLLVRRAEHPQLGVWSLPGGFVRADESLDAACERVLAAKAGLSGVFLEQLYTFGEPTRDPRTRVISVAYVALVADERLRAAVPDGDRDRLVSRILVRWKGEHGGPAIAHDEGDKAIPLAFDHAEIVGLAIKRLRGKIAYAPIGYELLPREFTLRQLQDVYEAILGRDLNKDSFRRKVLSTGELVATGTLEDRVGHRPAELYRFRARSARSGETK